MRILRWLLTKCTTVPTKKPTTPHNPTITLWWDQAEDRFVAAVIGGPGAKVYGKSPAGCIVHLNR